MRFVLALVVLTACSDDVEVTRLAGSPTATRALSFLEDDTPVAIGGDSEFGLAYLQRQDGDSWIRADGVPPFDAHAKLVRNQSYVFAIGETQVHQWERPFTWTPIQIPIATTPDTAFGVDMLGWIFAVELLPDGAGAVWRWRTDTTRWEEIAISRPIGIGATKFTVSPDGNHVAWSVPEVGITTVDLVAQTRTELACEELDGCTNVRGLTYASSSLLVALICDDEPNGRRSVLQIGGSSILSRELPDDGCRALSAIEYGTVLVVANHLHVMQGDSLDELTEADPALTYVLRDPSTAFGFGDGVYRIDF